MIVRVRRLMLDHHLQDRGDREQVGHPMRLDQPEGFGNVEALGRQQDGRGRPRGLHQLMHAGSVRQRRDHQRGVLLGGPGRQVGEMVGDDKPHLAVGQHGRLGTACRAGREEEPAGVVVLDGCVGNRGAGMSRNRLAHRALAEAAIATDPPAEVGAAHGSCMIGKVAVAQEGLRAGRGRKIGDFVRHQAEVGRHPYRAQAKGGKHRPEHLLAILGMNEDAVALFDPARLERGRKRGDFVIDLAPAP